MSKNEFNQKFDFEKEYTEEDFDLDALAAELGLDLSDEVEAEPVAEETVVEEAAPEVAEPEVEEPEVEAPAIVEAPAAEEDEFDLRSILGSDFEQNEMFGAEYEPDFDYGPEEETPAEPEEQYDEPLDLPFSAAASYEEEDLGGLSPEDFELPAEEPAYAFEPTSVQKPPRQRRERTKPDADAEPAEPKANPLAGVMEKVQGLFKSANKKAAPKQEAPKQEPKPAADPARPKKPVSPMRRFKNDVLPLIIIGATALLITIFVLGSVSRAIGNHLAEKEALASSSEAAKTAAELEAEEVQMLLAQANAQATGYDYDGAIATLESFAGDKNKYPDIDTMLSSYKQTKSLLVAHNDPGEVVNLSFHALIADPSRAFSDKDYGGSYNKNFVTIDEFEAILEQLYTNNFVLVDMDSFVAESVTGDTVTYASKTLYLPDGKKPLMITETMADYFDFMVDTDKDGNPDTNGGGFAHKLVLKNGEIKAEMVNASGETVVGNYELIPILEAFIDKHPDFSYQGARATIAVCGYDGVFGYKTNPKVIQSQGQEFYDAQVAAATEVCNAIRAAGYTFASYTYNNVDYGKKSANEIQADITTWTTEVLPILGEAQTLVYAKASDISTTGDYTGSKYTVLYNAGFRYFITSGSNPSATINASYVRQVRLMVTGTTMANAGSTYNQYFNAATLLNSQRGNVPQ